MKKLIEFVSKNVLKKTGVKLETEIKILEKFEKKNPYIIWRDI